MGFGYLGDVAPEGEEGRQNWSQRVKGERPKLKGEEHGMRVCAAKRLSHGLSINAYHKTRFTQ